MSKADDVLERTSEEPTQAARKVVYRGANHICFHWISSTQVRSGWRYVVKRRA